MKMQSKVTTFTTTRGFIKAHLSGVKSGVHPVRCMLHGKNGLRGNYFPCPPPPPPLLLINLARTLCMYMYMYAQPAMFSTTVLHCTYMYICTCTGSSTLPKIPQHRKRSKTPRIIIISLQLKRDSQKLFCDATRDATRSAMDACDANSRNTIHRRSQRCDKVLLIWVRHHDIRAV